MIRTRFFGSVDLSVVLRVVVLRAHVSSTSWWLKDLSPHKSMHACPHSSMAHLHEPTNMVAERRWESDANGQTRLSQSEIDRAVQEAEKHRNEDEADTTKTETKSADECRDEDKAVSQNEEEAAFAREFVIKVEDELQNFRDCILALMDENLISSTITGESKMSYHMLVGDYYRYLAEWPQSTPSKVADDACVAEAEATKIDEKFVDKAADVPVVLQRQVPVIQQVQETVVVPHVQYYDEVIDVPVVAQCRVPTAQKTEQAPQVQFLDPVVDVPVMMQ